MYNVIAIIPARGGSKGIQGKNIRMLRGKPLIAWTIEQALKSKHLDRIIVSTDNHQISEISKQYGVEVPFLRPRELAEEYSSTIDAVIHAIDFLETEGYIRTSVVILQPSSPLRISNDIDSAIEVFLKNDCDSVVSVCEFDHSPYWALKIKNNCLTPIYDQKYLRKSRQELPLSYIPNGAIFISTPENLRKYKSFYCPRNFLTLCLPIEALIMNLKKVIMISTDKAVNPINVMGATKLLAERLTISANYYVGDRDTVFSCVKLEMSLTPEDLLCQFSKNK